MWLTTHQGKLHSHIAHNLLHFWNTSRLLVCLDQAQTLQLVLQQHYRCHDIIFRCWNKNAKTKTSWNGMKNRHVTTCACWKQLNSFCLCHKSSPVYYLPLTAPEITCCHSVSSFPKKLPTQKRIWTADKETHAYSINQ